MAILIGIVLLLTVVWFGAKRSDPTYQGRTLSYWLRDLETKPGRNEYLQAQEALVHMGPVAAPRLARLLDYKESKLLTAIRAKMPNSLRNMPVLRLPAFPAFFIRSRAFEVLKEMGPGAQTAIPVLIRLVKSPDGDTRLWAVQILGFIGPAAESAVPVLLTMLKSGSAEERAFAAESIGRIGTSAAKAIPDLWSAMMAKRIPLGIAVPALIALGHSPVEAVPLLIAQLRANTNSPVPLSTIHCLGLIGAPAAPAVPALIDALQDPESRTRAQIASTLGQIGPNASNAVPALTGALDDEWWYVRENAAIALGKIGANASSAILVLAGLAQRDRNEDVRKAAFEAINSFRRDPSKPSAQ